MSGYNLSGEALAHLRQVVRQVLGEYRNPGSERGRWRGGQRQLQGKLDGALAAATSFANSPGTATLSVWEKNSSGNYEDSGRNVTVTHRFENLSFASGQILRVGWIDGEWQPTAADCE